MIKDKQNPILVDVWRGDLIESRHRGSICVVNQMGETIFSSGNIEKPVYARSSMKLIQALPLLDSGAAAELKLSTEQICLACSSHTGETIHTEAVGQWLSSLGMAESNLECGIHDPNDFLANKKLLASGQSASQLHNNCSGKHTGFLSLANHQGFDAEGYIHVDHPLQKMITNAIAEECQVELDEQKAALDGCSIPLFAVPLKNVARAYARFTITGSGRREKSRQKILQSICKHPLLIAGNGRFCSRIIGLSDHSVVTKTGAEGYYIAVLRDQRLGIAIKIEDGEKRASEVAMATLLRHFSTNERFVELLSIDERVVQYNAAGRMIGSIQPSQHLLSELKNT
ncbi:MAG: L-asparaginase II [Parasphingorhabdus sp.]|jgi:L-asparaginase II